MKICFSFASNRSFQLFTDQFDDIFEKYELFLKTVYVYASCVVFDFENLILDKNDLIADVITQLQNLVPKIDFYSCEVPNSVGELKHIDDETTETLQIKKSIYEMNKQFKASRPTNVSGIIVGCRERVGDVFDFQSFSNYAAAMAFVDFCVLHGREAYYVDRDVDALPVVTVNCPIIKKHNKIFIDIQFRRDLDSSCHVQLTSLFDTGAESTFVTRNDIGEIGLTKRDVKGRVKVGGLFGKGRALVYEVYVRPFSVEAHQFKYEKTVIYGPVEKTLFGMNDIKGYKFMLECGNLVLFIDPALGT